MKMKKMSLFLLVSLLCTYLLCAEDALSLFKRAQSSYYDEQYEETIHYLNDALAANPNYLDALVLLAHVYYESGNYEYAFTSINKALTLAAHRVDLIIFSADIETRLKRYDIAEGKYKKIIANDPLNMDAFNGLANLYLMTDRTILARDTLLGILKSDKGNFQALLRLAQYYEERDPRSAEGYYQKNISANSLNPEGYFQYSLFLFKGGRPKDALDQISIALELKDTVEYETYKGKYLLYLNRADDALAIFKKIAAGNHEGIIYYYLACGYAMIADYRNAVASLMKTLGVQHDDEAAALFLDTLLLDHYPAGSSERAERSLYYYQTALEAKKSSKFDLFLYGVRRAIQLNPANTDARMTLAEYYKVNNYPERYFRELSLIYQYSPVDDVKNRIEMESRNKAYRLGNDWGLNQYTVTSDAYKIPVFISNAITNRHYHIEQYYATLLTTLSYGKYTYELVPLIDREYTDAEKMRQAEKSDAPFYIDLTMAETATTADVSVSLVNAVNAQLIRKFTTYQVGNDRLLITGSSLLRKLDEVIPFRARIIKLSGDRAVINAGRSMGVGLKDTYRIVNRKNYPLQPGRTEYLVGKDEVKGAAIVVKVDENIAEIKFRDNDFFKDIDTDDMVIISENK